MIYRASCGEQRPWALGEWLGLAIVVAVGFYLRSHQIADQWLTDDEWHAVHRIVAGEGYWVLASRVGAADYSIPQTLIYKFLAEHGALSELVMRLPMLAAGGLLVAGGYLWARQNFDLTTAWCFGALIAISPFLVNYSRVARPYALTCLLCWLALLAFDRWWQDGERRHAIAYALLAVLACWLHMAVAPFVLAPLAWRALADGLKALGSRHFGEMLPVSALGALVTAGVAVLCLRPMLLSAGELASRLGTDLPTGPTYVGMFYSWLGSGASALVLIALALALAGVGGLHARRPRLLAMLLLGVAATLAGIYLSRPAWIQNPLTLARYLLPAQPLFLLCVAIGMARLTRLVRVSAVRLALVVGFPLLFFVGTPYADLLRVPNNFTMHYWYQFDYRKDHNPVRQGMKAMELHPFWRRFEGRPPGSVHFAVAGHGLESFTVPDVRWQLHHRQWVLSAQLTGYCNAPPYPGEALRAAGFALHNAVSLSEPDTLRSHRVDYLVFDRKGSTRVEQCIARYRREHGAPEFEDERLAVFRVNDGS